MSDETPVSGESIDPGYVVTDEGVEGKQPKAQLAQRGNRPPSLWRRMIAFLRWGASAQPASDRLRELNIAIDGYPNAPANYVFRGELYLETRMYELAAADFGTALELAAKQVDEERWGVVAQIVQDRAGRGLAEAQRILKAAHRDSIGE